MEEARIYLYGIMLAGTAPADLGVGIGGRTVHALRSDGFDALISQIPPDTIDFESEVLLAHEQVLTRAMEADTVIPAAFGHLLHDESELRELLSRAAQELQANLQHLHGCVEVGLKAVWPKESFLTDIETPELRALLNEACDPGADLDLAMEVGQLVERLVEQRREQYVTDLYQRLREVALDGCLNDPATSRMIFNAAFLIPRDGQDAFFRHLQELAAPYADRIELHYSGPWPPHNFSRLRLQ